MIEACSNMIPKTSNQTNNKSQYSKSENKFRLYFLIHSYSSHFLMMLPLGFSPKYTFIHSFCLYVLAFILQQMYSFSYHTTLMRGISIKMTEYLPGYLTTRNFEKSFYQFVMLNYGLSIPLVSCLLLLYINHL